MNRYRAVALLLVAAAMAACTAQTSTPAAADKPRESAGSDAKQAYLKLQQQAMEEMKAWQAGQAGPGAPDPRPAWAGRLEQFAREHPGTEEAAHALLGAMELHSIRGEVDGFFGSYDLMLAIAPDAPALQGVFAQVTTMRMVEAGGPGIMDSTDIEQKRRAYLKAVPLIVADVERAIKATKNPATVAAAHYTIGSTYYQLEVDPRKALEHFQLVSEEHPTWSHADSAREYVRELQRLSLGMTAPDLEATTLDGKRVTLSSLRGKVVLVDFWATWCQPCVRELPHLKRAYERYRSRGFAILGVSLDNDVPAVRRFIASQRMNWHTVASGLALSDPLARQYNVQTIPMSYLVDRRGIIRGRALFGNDVERAVGEILAQESPPR